MLKGAMRGVGLHGIGTIGGLLSYIGATDTGKAVSDFGADFASEFPAHPSVAGSWMDSPGLLANPSWWSSQIGEQVPLLASLYFTRRLGTAAGLSGAGQAMLGGGLAGAMEVLPEFQENLEAGMGPVESRLRGLGGMIGVGALNALPLGEAFAGKGGLLKRALTTGALEAGTEYAEEPVQALTWGRDIGDALYRGLEVIPVSALMGAGEAVIGEYGRTKPEARGTVWNPEPNEDPISFSKRYSESLASFLDSSVVNEPLYHSTPKTFDAFDLGRSELGIHLGTKEAANDMNRASKSDVPMTVMTEGPDGTVYDGDLVPPVRQGTNIMPVYARITNPLRVPDLGDFSDPLEWENVARKLDVPNKLKYDIFFLASRYGKAMRDVNLSGKTWERMSRTFQKKLRTLLEKAGYDGLVYTNEKEGVGSDSFVVFNPNAVKSAIGNIGLTGQGGFDISTPNILFDVNKTEAPFRNKDGSWRSNGKGDIAGAPDGVKSDVDVDVLTHKVLDMLYDEDSFADPDNPESSLYWYDRSGAEMAAQSHGDGDLLERMLRVAAFTSRSNKVGNNVNQTIGNIYQLARGEKATRMRYPKRDVAMLDAILKAPKMDKSIPGVDDKVMNFYLNLKAAATGNASIADDTTVDMWIARLFGYKDKPTRAQYRFANMIMKRVTALYNLKHGSNLTPYQIQAALWTYARNKGLDETFDDGGVNTKDQSKTKQKKKTSSAIDFSTYFRRAEANVTAEAIPSTSTRDGAWLSKQPFSVRAEYTKGAFSVTRDASGHDLLLEAILAPMYSESMSVGAYGGRANPNQVISVPTERVPVLDEKGNPVNKKGLPVYHNLTDVADLIALSELYIHSQDSVPWFRFDDTVRKTAENAANGVRLNFTEALTIDEVEQIYDIVNKVFAEKIYGDKKIAKKFNLDASEHHDIGSTAIGNDLVFVNINDVTNIDYRTFQNAFREVINALPDSIVAKMRKHKDGSVDYTTNITGEMNYVSIEGLGASWGDEAEAVQAVEAELTRRGRSDLLDPLRHWRKKVEDYRKNFIKNPISQSRSASTLNGVDPQRTASKLNFTVHVSEIANRDTFLGSRGEAFKIYSSMKLAAARTIHTIPLNSNTELDNLNSGEILNAIDDLIASGMPVNAFRFVDGVSLIRGGVFPDNVGGIYNRDSNIVGFRPISYGARDEIVYTEFDSHEFRLNVAHEFGHSVDNAARSPTTAFSSETSAVFNIGLETNRNVTAGEVLGSMPKFDVDNLSFTGFDNAGEIMREAFEAYNAKNAMGTLLTYPLNSLAHTLFDLQNTVNLDVVPTDVIENTLNTVKSELFAQIFAAYYTAKNDLKVEMPRAFKMMEMIDESLRIQDSAKSVDGIRKAIRGVSTSGGVSQSNAGTSLSFTRTRNQGWQPTGNAEERVLLSTRVAGTDMEPFFKRMSSKEGVEQAIIERMHSAEGEYEEARGGVMSVEEMQASASEYGFTANDLKELKLTRDRFEAGRSVVDEYLRNLNASAERALKGGDIEKAEFAAALDAFDPVLKTWLGIRADWGRIGVLMQHGTRQLKDLHAVMDTFGGKDNVEIMAQLIVEANQMGMPPGMQADLVRKMQEPRFIEKIVEAWQMGLLSGPTTHVVNVLSTGLATVMEDVSHIIAGTLGTITGGDYRISEALARVFGSANGAAHGLRWFARAIKNPDVAFLYGDSKFDVRHRRAIKGVKGEIIRIPGRLLNAEDMFFKAYVWHKGAASQASILARKNGISQREAMAEILEGKTERAKEIRKTLWEEANLATFTSPPGELTEDVLAMMIRHPWMRFIAPFVNTPVNIIKFAFRYTPLASVMASVRKELHSGTDSRNLAIARMGVGTGIMALGLIAAAGGLITGQGPEDPRERELWYKRGFRPYSVRINGKWIPYNRMEPFGILFGMTADAYELTRYMDNLEAQELAGMIWGSVVKNLTSKTYLKGLSDWVQALTDPERYGERLIGGYAGSLVPTGVAAVARTQDPTLRRAETLLDSIRKRIPGMSDQLLPRLDVSGKPITFATSIWNPLIGQPIEIDPVAEALAAADYYPGKISDKVRGVQLTPEMHNQLIEESRTAAWRILSRITASDRWQRLPTEIQRKILRSVFTETADIARTRLLLQNSRYFVEAIAAERR